MADPLSFLFDTSWQRRSDLNATRREVVEARQSLAWLTERLDQAEQRADRLELALESLLTWLDQEGVAPRDKLAAIVQRLDLVARRDDSAIPPEQDATPCGSCGRPMHPDRAACLYCGEAPAQVARPEPRHLLPCGTCGQAVPEDQMFATSDGMECDTCYFGEGVRS